MDLRSGQILQHYRLVEKIGEGGMGVVWKAQDTRLHRHVALKFVPEDAAPNRKNVDRHLREARAASAMNHPHICSIHDTKPEACAGYPSSRELAERMKCPGIEQMED